MPYPDEEEIEEEEEEEEAVLFSLLFVKEFWLVVVVEDYDMMWFNIFFPLRFDVWWTLSSWKMWRT